MTEATSSTPGLEAAAQEFLKEQKRKRRWGLFFKFIYLAIFLLIVLSLFSGNGPDTGKERKSHVALVDVHGPIFAKGTASAKQVNKAIDNAFDSKKTEAVILQINSPGGSPVQADDIYQEVMYQRHKHPAVKVYAVCSDICASGAYYVASSANEIYANPSSLVGSIGVIMNGFGFVDTLQKLGAQRRLVISGKNKAFMDPFSPLKETDQAHAQAMLDQVHQTFIKRVEQGRGKRLKVNADTFTGEIFTGINAKQMGLVDGFGDTRTVTRDVIKNTNVVDYTEKPSLFDSFGVTMGTTMAHTAMDAMGFGENKLS